MCLYSGFSWTYFQGVNNRWFRAEYMRDKDAILENIESSVESEEKNTRTFCQEYRIQGTSKLR